MRVTVSEDEMCSHLLRLNCLPLNPYVEALSANPLPPPPPHTHSETGDEASKEVIKLNEVICMAPINMTSVLTGEIRIPIESTM